MVRGRREEAEEVGNTDLGEVRVFRHAFCLNSNCGCQEFTTKEGENMSQAWVHEQSVELGYKDHKFFMIVTPGVHGTSRRFRMLRRGYGGSCLSPQQFRRLRQEGNHEFNFRLSRTKRS